jgi:hypothetical protein
LQGDVFGVSKQYMNGLKASFLPFPAIPAEPWKTLPISRYPGETPAMLKLYGLNTIARQLPTGKSLICSSVPTTPTTLNRQGADVGTQYRSAIFYMNETQREIAQEIIREKSDDFSSPIVTEVSPLGEFFTAESYHQDYFDNNPNAAYCRIVIAPKLEHLGFE